MNTALSPGLLIGVVAAYFAVLVALSWWTSRGGGGNDDFFLAGRNSPWPLVAFGMIGATLSGVTFISIPGWVRDSSFGYMQVVFGYLLGYLFIGAVLLPLYYRLGLTSIYEFLGRRIGPHAYRVGAGYFILSRSLGAALRLYLVAIVLDEFVTGPLGFPFFLTVLVTIVLIWLYTFRGGIKTIVYTDTLQTVFLLTAAALTVYFIGVKLETGPQALITQLRASDYTQIFFFEGGWSDPNNFWKQFISGALIAIVMTGLDQDMMQKNLSMPNVRDAQKNMASFSIVLVFANLFFLCLGALLYIYAARVGVPELDSTDHLYPTVALRHLPAAAGITFLLGLIAAAYSSADSALTSLTTSFCVDFLGMPPASTTAPRPRRGTTTSAAPAGSPNSPETDFPRKRTRLLVHAGFSVVLLVIILTVRQLGLGRAVIDLLFKAAGYTYGPLLGLFAYGMFTRLRLREVVVVAGFRVPLLVLVCILAPLFSVWLDLNSETLLGGFNFGYLILAFNGLLTFLGLIALSDFGDLAAEEES